MPSLTPELVADLEHFANVMFWAGAGFGGGVALTFAVGVYLIACKRSA